MDSVPSGCSVIIAESRNLFLPFPIQTELVFAARSADTAMGEDGAQLQGDATAQAPTQVAPALLWKPERVAADLKLSRQLIEKLDEEKGIAGNPLIAADKLNGTQTG